MVGTYLPVFSYALTKLAPVNSMGETSYFRIIHYFKTIRYFRIIRYFKIFRYVKVRGYKTIALSTEGTT